ncbi:hypothetical protein RRG08_011603 [Elysia crispata]|uniref:Uncharacterized protein n=1 Tax=Elysia crispata TaxID=231223 RepID=A0AAE0XPF1_9GAST|nr:hypothetical protein RRG08_011603 [Elysia crispata]
MIRDKLVFTATKRFQEKLLRDELTLDKDISICRAYEHSTSDMKEMIKLETKIEKVSNKSQLEQQEKMGNQRQNDCRFCGRKHPLRKKNVQPEAKRAQTAEAETTSASNAKKSTLSLKTTTLTMTMSQVHG